MKIYNSIFIILICMMGCAEFRTNKDDKYQPLGEAVITANRLLMLDYPQGIPKNFSSDDYKHLLKEDNKSMYEILQPYRVEVQKKDKNFITRVYDGNILVLVDWSCTEIKIDCWTYDGKCNPDTMHIRCPD
jgi:hypothetical protein